MVPSSSRALEVIAAQEYAWSFSVQYELTAFRGVGAALRELRTGRSETLEISVCLSILCCVVV